MRRSCEALVLLSLLLQLHCAVASPIRPMIAAGGTKSTQLYRVTFAAPPGHTGFTAAFAPIGPPVEGWVMALGDATAYDAASGTRRRMQNAFDIDLCLSVTRNAFSGGTYFATLHALLPSGLPDLFTSALFALNASTGANAAAQYNAAVSCIKLQQGL